MQWEPKPQGLEELVKLFQESLGSNNQKHREVFEVGFIEKLIFIENKYLQQKQRVHKLFALHSQQRGNGGRYPSDFWAHPQGNYGTSVPGDAWGGYRVLQEKYSQVLLAFEAFDQKNNF